MAEGPLAFSFSDYQIWPTTFDYTPATLPRPVRTRHAGELTVQFACEGTKMALPVGEGLLWGEEARVEGQGARSPPAPSPRVLQLTDVRGQISLGQMTMYVLLFRQGQAAVSAILAAISGM